MKAFVVEKYGMDGLRGAADLPTPSIGRGDVLVQVSAASINPLDKMIRDGEFKRIIKRKPPFVLGHDLAGVVIEIGDDVHDFKVGDEVYGRPRDLRAGTFAELISVDQHDIALKPESLTLPEAAAVPLVALAAWQILVDRAQMQPGQKVLVHAGAGGLGSTVIQLAKAPRRNRGDYHQYRHGRTGSRAWRRRRRRLHHRGLCKRAVRLRPRCRLLGGANLEKSLTVLKPGGLAVESPDLPMPGSPSRSVRQRFLASS